MTRQHGHGLSSHMSLLGEINITLSPESLTSVALNVLMYQEHIRTSGVVRFLSLSYLKACPIMTLIKQT